MEPETKVADGTATTPPPFIPSPSKAETDEDHADGLYLTGEDLAPIAISSEIQPVLQTTENMKALGNAMGAAVRLWFNGEDDAADALRVLITSLVPEPMLPVFINDYVSRSVVDPSRLPGSGPERLIVMADDRLAVAAAELWLAGHPLATETRALARRIG